MATKSAMKPTAALTAMPSLLGAGPTGISARSVELARKLLAMGPVKLMSTGYRTVASKAALVSGATGGATAGAASMHVAHFGYLEADLARTHFDAKAFAELAQEFADSVTAEKALTLWTTQIQQALVDDGYEFVATSSLSVVRGAEWCHRQTLQHWLDPLTGRPLFLKASLTLPLRVEDAGVTYLGVLLAEELEQLDAGAHFAATEVSLSGRRNLGTTAEGISRVLRAHVETSLAQSLVSELPLQVGNFIRQVASHQSR